MNNRAKTPAFVLGLFGGSINAFLGIIALVIFISLSSALSQLSQFSYGYDATPQILFFIGIILVCFLNYTGALICIRKRIAGGVIMLITAALLIILTIIILSNISDSVSLNPFGGSSSDYFGYTSPLTAFSSGGIVIIVLWMLVELTSVIGAILCFSPARQNPMPLYNQPYGQPYSVPYGQQQYGQQPPYAQPYRQPPYQQPSFGQQPYQQPPYGQQPYQSNKTEE